MNIYLLRHGETDWNKEGRIQGHTDIRLNQNGRMQVVRTATRLAGICPNIDMILCSPLSRARESAEIAAERLNYPKDRIIEEPLFIERCFGEAEGMTAMEREQKYPNYHYSDTDYRFPGMESYEEIMKRAQTAFDTVVHKFRDKDNILVASHGAILQAVVTTISDGKIAYFSDTVRFDSGSLYRVCYTNGAVKLALFSADESMFINIGF